MKIFISYRHGEEGVAAYANLVYERMCRHFGASAVFLDNLELRAGEAFPAAIETWLRASQVVLVLIDPRWIGTIPRLHEPADWVRRELEIALQRRLNDGVRVIPLLLQGAPMPEVASLPPSLAPLADLNAITLRSSTLDDDLASLVQRLQGSTPERMLLWLRARRRAAVAAALGLTLLMCASVAALFDALTIDTRLEALTLAWAEALDPPQQHPRLLTVGIDRRSEQGVGRPFDRSWRAEHARVIRTLAAGGAAAVAFDVYLEGSSPQDAELTAAAEQARARGTRVIFGIARAGAAPALATTAIDWGLLCIGTELDWSRLAALALRRPAAQATPPAPPPPAGAAPARWDIEAALALRAVHGAAAWQELDADQHLMRAAAVGGAEPLRVPFSRQARVVGEQTCSAMLPGDEVAQRLVRFTPLDALRDPSRRLRYEDLCCGTGAPPRPDAWRDRIVLIGSELQTRDLREVLRGLGSEPRWGYEIHADMVNTLLDGADLRPLGTLPQFLVMLAMAGVGLLLRFWRRLWTPWRTRAVLLGVPLAYLAFSAWLCASAQLLLNGAYHLGAFFFAFWVAGVVLRRSGLQHRGGD